MTPFFYLIYLFTIVNGGDSIDVWISTDLNPFIYERQGCTILGHELYHWFGYAEHEIPYCEISQEFR